MRVVDLFCGIGGFSEGARQCGHDVSIAIDSNSELLRTHAKNHKDCKHFCVTLPEGMPDISTSDIETHIHASPPCQSLSQANRIKRKDDVDTSLKLVQWYLTYVLERKPTTWSFEQVSTPAVLKMITEFSILHKHFCKFAVINCSNFHVPQDRKRLIAGSPCIIDRLLSKQQIYKTSVIDVFKETPTEFMQNTTTNTPIRTSDGVTVGYRKLLPLEHTRPVTMPSFTVLATQPLRWAHVDGSVLRSMTVEESAKLQTFPVNYDLGDRLRQRGVGNAVPPRVAKMMMDSAPLA